MNLENLIPLMEHHAHAIQTLTRGLTPDQSRWRPSAEAWSVLEVINHLYDEEREDFRARLEIILFRPQEPWQPIHPSAWVTERAYNSRDLETSVGNYLAERENSLLWLRKLGSPNWDTTAPAPWGGEIRAGDMFSAWVAHDVLHLRQLVELRYALLKESVQPFQIEYAGDW